MVRSSSKICALVILLAAPPAARGALYSEPHCDDLLPEVLNVGLPRVPGLDLGAVREAARQRLTELYRPLDVCAGRKRLQVNIAIGCDYQILDWLGQGLIDVAVVPDLSLYLLGRDGVKLLEPPVAPDGLNDILAPWEARLRSRSFAAGAWTDRPEPERDFESLRWQLWCGALAKGAPGTAPGSDRRRCAEIARGPEYRLALTSHLSTGGFLRPVSRTAVWLADRLAAAKLDPGGKKGRELADRFWAAFFDHARFTLDGTLAEGPAAGKLIEIAADAVPAGASAAPAYRNHLVITARAADAIFNGHAFPRPAVELAPELKAAFESDPAPAAFRSMLAAEPYFGVRTFGFTVGETIGLLRQHQTTSGRARLALVLPGGGVKAVYQSQLVDSLYGGEYLKNVLTDKDSLRVPRPRAGASPLDVDFVVGTSGGALLGYFVARLAEGGPWNLSDVLWQNKEEKILDSTDIFGWTDLPRYLSVVAIFLVFSFLLFLSSAILRSISVEPPASEDFWRPRLTLAIVPLLLLTPVLIRWVNGRHAQEHIPEIEGLFFAICTCAALFADQCLVYRREPRPNGKLPIHPVLPLLLGLALVVVPLLPVWNTGEGDRWLDRPVSFLSAFLIFVLLGVGGALILPRRLLQSSRPFGRRLALAAAELCGAALLALPLLFLPASLWSRVGKLPFFLVGFALMLLVVGSNPRLRQRSEQLAVASRRGGYYLGLFTAACLVLLLCRPDDMSTGPGLGPLIFRESRLNLPGGSLLICLGILSLLVAGMLWTYASRHYRLEEVPGFRAGFTLSLFLVFAVYLVLGAVMIVRPNMLSPLELTMGFWKWLLVTSLVLGLVILFTSRAGRGSRWSRRVSCGLSYLCSHHPNSSLVSRRYLRIAVLGIGSFLWWNFVLAPALYGNAHARGFLTVAEGRFHREYERGNPRQDAHRLTANLLVPANVLERDGTRFFLVVPGQIPDCPPISSKPGSGALWYTYRIEPPVRTEVGVPLPGCPNFRQRSPEDVEEVIFASGSPFPIFPAHLVELSDKAGKAKWQALVDGGYSNNEPVDAALNVSAEQVLIVESTNPLGPATAAESGASRLSMLVGPLVADLLRLPGFLFERSQQVDRLSRRGLFVVSLSPSRDATDWPPLFDFRRQVVEHLRETARQDLARRIGLVESWGPPRFQLSVLIGSGY